MSLIKNDRDFEMKNSFVFTLIIFFLAISCRENSTKPDEGTGSIRGKVYDAKTHEPLGWVEISTTPATSIQITDTTGSFRILNVPAGDYKLRAYKYGDQIKEANVRVFGGKETIADLLMTKGFFSTTLSTDTTGTPDIFKYLIAYYKFDSDAKDYSPNHLDGNALLVRYVADRFGEEGKAIEFLGNAQSYVDVV
jgi:hypothetical protein